MASGAAQGEIDKGKSRRKKDAANQKEESASCETNITHGLRALIEERAAVTSGQDLTNEALLSQMRHAAAQAGLAPPGLPSPSAKVSGGGRTRSSFNMPPEQPPPPQQQAKSEFTYCSPQPSTTLPRVETPPVSVMRITPKSLKNYAGPGEADFSDDEDEAEDTEPDPAAKEKSPFPTLSLADALSQDTKEAAAQVTGGWSQTSEPMVRVSTVSPDKAALVGTWKDTLGNEIFVPPPNASQEMVAVCASQAGVKELQIVAEPSRNSISGQLLWCGNGAFVEAVYAADAGASAAPLRIRWKTKSGRVSVWYKEGDDVQEANSWYPATGQWQGNTHSWSQAQAQVFNAAGAKGGWQFAQPATQTMAPSYGWGKGPAPVWDNKGKGAGHKGGGYAPNWSWANVNRAYNAA